MRALAMLCALVGSAVVGGAADPVRTAWILHPAAGVEAGKSAVLPDVHAVEYGGEFVTVRSAGISLRYLGPLQMAPVPSESAREFVFRIPLHPRPETGTHARVPVGAIGTFVNGLPVWNQFETLSYNGANLWHYDAVAAKDDGTLTAGGRARAELTHPAAAGLVEQLIQASGRHSPLIGFALDGYPIYGPWGWANADGTGGPRRMRSSYRLRAISRRETWPDGTELTPEQYGPEVSAANPLGTFAEDYEYVERSGDLDRYNGRFAVTPEYPEGRYAYFLATDERGRLAYPYLIGPRYYGRAPADAQPEFVTIGKERLTLGSSAGRPQAGRAVRFRLEATDRRGERIRAFESVHERPIHLLVASADLAEFDHIHPQLAADDSYQVEYTFAHGGRYRMWADYSLPGEAPHVDTFDVTVEGRPRPVEKLTPSTCTRKAGTLEVTLEARQPLRAGEDIPITLKLSGGTARLEPYLGAWAHVVVVSEDLRSFTHAHPVDGAPVMNATHTHVMPGPPPDAVRIVTSFPRAGRYKLWAQFQQSGGVLTLPFVLEVGERRGARAEAIPVPADAIRIRIGQHGYEPARIEMPAGKKVTLAFTRDAEPNCAAEVVIPSLGIRRKIAPGETVVVEIPAQAAGEIAFGCGMGMFRGMLVAG
jgi:hypothetical protein